MSMWAKLVAALRSGLSGDEEGVRDTKVLVLLDREVREATEELKQSKADLAVLMARQKVAQEKCAHYQASIDEYEGYAAEALDKGEEALALEVAQKVADLEQHLQHEREMELALNGSVKQMQTAVKMAEQNIRRLKQQIDTVKAAENVLRAQMSVGERLGQSSSNFNTAMDSLERIKQRQRQQQSEVEAVTAMEERFASDTLEAKLRAAGIATHGADAKKVLQRLKKNK